MPMRGFKNYVLNHAKLAGTVGGLAHSPAGVADPQRATAWREALGE